MQKCPQCQKKWKKAEKRELEKSSEHLPVLENFELFSLGNTTLPNRCFGCCDYKNSAIILNQLRIPALQILMRIKKWIAIWYLKKVHLKHYISEKFNGFPHLICELHMATYFQVRKWEKGLTLEWSWQTLRQPINGTSTLVSHVDRMYSW